MLQLLHFILTSPNLLEIVNMVQGLPNEDKKQAFKYQSKNLILYIVFLLLHTCDFQYYLFFQVLFVYDRETLIVYLPSRGNHSIKFVLSLFVSVYLKILGRKPKRELILFYLVKR